MDHPRTARRLLLDRTRLRRPRVQIAIAAALILSLLGLTSAILAAGTSTITITPVTAGNISEGAGTASFLVSLSDPISDGSVQITVATHNGAGANGAGAGSDYTAVSQVVTFTSSSQNPVTVNVPITDDVVDEPNETFTIDLTTLVNGSTTTILVASPITVIIQDNDSPSLASLTGPAAAVAESAGSASFTATLSAVSPQPVTLNWHLVGSSADPATIPPGTPADVTLASGSWVIPINAISGSFTIGIVNDALPENTEQFQVVIDSVANIANTAFALSQSPTATITDDDTTPTVPTNNGLTVNEGATGTIGQAQLEATDPQQSAAQLTFKIGTAPANGKVFRSGVELKANDTFTQQDINANLITYTHSGTETTSDSFTFTVSDGNTSTTSQTFNITINAANDPPSITPGGDVSGTEDTAYAANWFNPSSFVPGPSGESAQTLLSITTTANSNAALFTAGGQPAVSPTTGDLSFTPAPDANGSASITIAVKDSGGTANGGVDTTTYTFSITVAAVNDPPSITPGSDVNGAENAAYAASWFSPASFVPGPSDEFQPDPAVDHHDRQQQRGALHGRRPARGQPDHRQPELHPGAERQRQRQHHHHGEG